ncbi:MAG TPA: hypothetical protein VIJ47_16295 [Acidimicrobiales bacterium]
MTPSIDEITVGDEPKSWRAAGFTVDDDGVCRIGTVRVRLIGRERGKRILDWSLRDIDADALTDGGLDGLPTAPSSAPPAEPAIHANGVRSIDHVVLLSPDTARTTTALEAVGFDVRRVRETDSYGSPMRQVFFRAGEVIIELVGPDEPGEGATGFFGLALTVDDLEATAALLGPALGRPKDAVQPGRRIASLRHKDLDISVATALMTPEPA